MGAKGMEIDIRSKKPLNRRIDCLRYTLTSLTVSSGEQGFIGDSLPYFVEFSLWELQDIATRQKGLIESQRRILLAKEMRLRRLKLGRPRTNQIAAENEILKRLRERVEKQELELGKLRGLRGRTDDDRRCNGTLTSDLDSVRALRDEKEREMEFLVAMAEDLERTKERQRVGGYRITSQRQEEINSINRRIADLQDRLQRKRLECSGVQAVNDPQEKNEEIDTLEGGSDGAARLSEVLSVCTSFNSANPSRTGEKCESDPLFGNCDTQVVLRKDNLKKGSGRRVSFDPLALLLDAALEGELELVMQTVSQVSDPSGANDEGITALHNAVCAGHLEVVRFLVEFGCDVNAQDGDGWMPLHCAASCNNLPMVRLLVEHGACIYARTLTDHETAAEKCEEDEDGFDGCFQYLCSVQEELGVSRKGVVYAVCNYSARSSDELSFADGDSLVVLRKGEEPDGEWWWARLEDKEGYTPRNLFGLYPRVRPRQ
ncbi:UNVERIFIED_CONTAM: hypothetical protein PYX00_005808 [Menopon gallinae]|uniref:SH3 domain-containing protein n=1 Tax=Menopon gallinae TaxID=328185 RepID=A0AAW2HUQ3_9NEOP